MTLEQYILMRKKEDGINEFDLSKRSENIRLCVNYIFEYFDNYLENSPDSERTIKEENKRDKYRQLISDYSPEVQNWLVEMHSRSGKHVHRHLKKLIEDQFFLLYSTDAEFRAMSYAIYPTAIKKVKELDGEGEMIYLFIRDEHRIKSELSLEQQGIHITDDIDKWITKTYKKYGVNIYAFCLEWIYHFAETPNLWPKARKIRDHEYDSLLGYRGYTLSNDAFWKYDYKADGELFDLNALYRKMPKKDFIRGHKQALEAVMMYCWTHDWEDDELYWEKYISEVEHIK